MRSSIATYRESLCRLAGEVDDATADEIPAPWPSRRGDHAPTPPSSGRRRRYTRPDPAEPDEISKLKEDIEKIQASEAEIKALSFNYAAMLKEKEEQLVKLREENGSLRRSMESSNYKAVSGNSNGTLQRSPSRMQRNTDQEKTSSVLKQNGYGGGASQVIQKNGPHPLPVHYKGDALVEERAYFASKQASLENEIKQLKQQLRCYSNKEDETTRRLEDENKRNEFLQQQLNELKVGREMVATTMEELHKELSEKKAELRCLQDELSTRDNECASDGSLQSLRSMVMALQKENSDLKIAKGSLDEELVDMESTTQNVDNSTSDVDNFSDVGKVKDEMASLKKALQGAFHERDRALQNLSRLKQHLLDKDLEDQEKMDEDSKVIEELRVICEQQRAHIVQLERALKVEMTKQEESKKTINDEHSRSNEQIEDLQYKLANCMNALESKDQELLNLQSALGQYYAESEAKERLGDDLAMAREALAKLSESLKVANQGIEISRREKDEVVAKLTQAEKMLADGKRSLQKLEDDNSRLRHALEQSMTTVNRMSLDSDNSVDRRIVIKLLVTYFQRNHSKEVLDLMVRMLGFSEEDKQRIGSAQSNVGKVVVRGVLGLPGRLVGGFVGGNSAGKSTHAPQDNQSFADLWVDFLLKETEEREKQKASEAAARLSQEENQTTSRIASNLQASQHIANPGLSTKPHQCDRPDSDEFRMFPLAPMYTSTQTPLK
ncbi:golgin candidate 3-like isoform X1 [Triticum dicoccoides]|uniref:golgin candidate 3-like isoform X1 n=1 Tax=Triticum dicoccoides TaxID=85692 RepID=UPI001891E4EC|nr:golgin candidate 3-like isoform X1 [Triticum dicoccoides]